MEISQKRSSARTTYTFHDDRLDYSWKDSSGSRSFSVRYVDISRDNEGRGSHSRTHPAAR